MSVPGPKPMAHIDRFTRERGAWCTDCNWRNKECNRTRAVEHARREEHVVEFIVEHVTAYWPAVTP